MRFVMSAVCLASVLAFGQSNIAIITGIATDSSGAIVPNAQVTITNQETAIVFRTETNASGIYTAASLNPGMYSLEVEAAGFKKSRTQNVLLETGQRLRLDVTLDLGAVSDTITVQATTAPLKQETSEVSTNIGSKEIRNLPIIGRQPNGLMFMSPGVVSNGDAGNQDYGGGTSINGSRTQGTAFLLDGAPAVSADGYAERLGSIEAIHEVKLMTGTYSAEFGRTSGTVVTSQVKSGTNEIHGSLFEYHQNNVFNANNWQNNATGIPASSLKRNEFGGTIGGAVPGTKKKLFYFLSYEGYRDRIPINRPRMIPDAAIRKGDFSSLPSIINDPLTGSPFPNNVIPSSRLDPAAVKFLELFPAPNTQGVFNSRFGVYTNNWLRAATQTYPKNWGLGRWDYNPTDHDKIYFTLGYIKEGLRDEGVEFENVLNTIRAPSQREMKRATFAYTRFFTTNVTNEFQAYAQRDPVSQNPWYPDYNVTTELGIQRRVGQTIPTISISGGYGSFGNSQTTWNINQPAGFSDIVTWVRGRHTLRMGTQLYQHQYPYGGSANTAGSYSFTGEITGLGAAGRDVPGNALADLLLGAVKTANIDVPQIPAAKLFYNFALFINDDWKVTKRLTLNIGLRYEFETRMVVKNNIYSSVDLQTGNLLVAGKNASRNLNLKNDFLNFSPRVGFAYSLNDKTVIRAGFGEFFAGRVVDSGTQVTFPGYTGSVVFPDQGIGKAQPFTFSQGFPVASVPSVTDPLAAFAAATPQNPLSISSSGFPVDAPLPDSLQWHFGVQRDLGSGVVVEVSYLGSRSVHLARTVPANNPTLDKATAVVVQRVPIQQVRPFQNLSAFNAVLYDANSSYHSLQTKLTRRFNSGLSLDGTYTFSKNIDTATKFNDSFQIPWQFASIERSLSSLDRTHVATLGWVYELPFGAGKQWLSSNRFLAAVIGGFQVNGILSASTGLPMTIRQNNTNVLLSAQRPDVVDPSNLSGRDSDPTFVGAAYRWLVPVGDPSFPFRNSSTVGIGNLGRNTTRAPGYWNLNLGIFRVFRIMDRASIELRAEAYNALNHVNWGSPGTNIDSANYGLITGSSNARQMKLGVRIAF